MTLSDEDTEILAGAIETPDGESITLELPRLHWKLLKHLIDAGFDNMGRDIADLLSDPNRQDETDTELVIWLLDMYYSWAMED